MNKFKLINKIIYFSKFNNKSELEDELIKLELQEFYKLFTEDIKIIYKSHPINDTEESKQFWNNKRRPSEFKFNNQDEICINFLFNFIKIFSNLLMINNSLTTNINYFEEKLNEILKNYNISQILDNSEQKIIFDKIVLAKNEFIKNNELFQKI
jgi:hypothetical protein